MPIWTLHDSDSDSDSSDDCYYAYASAVEVIRPSPRRDFYCHDCDRTFLNENNLQQHLRSRVHLGQDITCPYCSRTFTTATGVVHHLERGSCPRARYIDREQIFNIMKQRDPDGYVTNLLLQYDSSTYSASHRCWNGHAYQCYLCPRQFRALHSLNQHLRSPTHQQSLYHCPNRRSCGEQFTTLAAAINHLESERCGFMTFNDVQNTMGNLIGSNRRLAF